MKKSKNKIVVLNPVGFMGGAEVSLLEFLKYYREHVVTVVVPFEGDFTIELKNNEIKYFVIQPDKNFNRIHRKKIYFNNIISIITYSQKIYGLIKMLDFDIIYSNGLKTDLISLYLKFKLKKDIIWHIRDILNIKFKILFSVSSLLCKKLICNSEFTAKQFFFKKKTTTIFNPIPEINLKKLKNKKRFILGMAGHLTNLKNIHIAIKSLTFLPSNYKLLIYGKEPYKTHSGYGQFLKKITKHFNLENQVEFHAFDTNIKNFLQQVDLVLCLSSKESFGRVQFEALSSNTPVITTQTGFFYNKKDLKYPIIIPLKNLNPDKVAEKIVKVRKNFYFYNKKCQKYYMKIRNEFDTMHINKKIEKVINS
ncbi:MAG: glycosyltransferase [Candidatus Muiribacteriota bacterium]